MLRRQLIKEKHLKLLSVCSNSSVDYAAQGDQGAYFLCSKSDSKLLSQAKGFLVSREGRKQNHILQSTEQQYSTTVDLLNVYLDRFFFWVIRVTYRDDRRPGRSGVLTYVYTNLPLDRNSSSQRTLNNN